MRDIEAILCDRAATVGVVARRMRLLPWRRSGGQLLLRVMRSRLRQLLRFATQLSALFADLFEQAHVVI